MVYLRSLCLIEVLSSLQSFGKDYMSQWIRSWILVWLITLRLTDKPSDSIKSLKTCWELVLYSMAEVGIRVYPMASFHTTIVTKKAWRWCHSRCYMVEDAELLYSRMRLESDKFLDQTLYKTLWNRSVLWERTWTLSNHAKRVMQTVGEEIWVLKSEILYTSRCHLWEDSSIQS
jgi:hypothetical protein